MKKVLILGAGIYQVPLIKKSKQLGYYTIVSSIPGNYPGFLYADKVYYVNTVDREAILKLAREEKIDAILTTGTDVAVSTIGYVCDKQGLCGISEETAHGVTNKACMKKLLKKGGVRTADFHVVKSLDEAYDVYDRMETPVIFKSVDLSGSRGIMKVDSREQIPTAFKYAMSKTHCDYILIEEFLDGYEIGVDGYIGNGNCFIVPHDKLVYFNGATNVPIGHIFPYFCSDELRADICEQIEKALYALHLERVFFNADVMICGEKSYLIEIGARCGATCIPELISTHYGIDYYELMIRNAMGERLYFPSKPVCVSMGRLLLSEKSGCITDVRINTPLDKVDQLVLDFGVGDHVDKFVVGADRIGHLAVHASDFETAKQLLEDASASIQIIVDESR